MIEPGDKVNYRYLNMDSKQFAPSQEELTKQIGKGAMLMAFHNYEHGQMLIAGGIKPFSESSAILTCRRLSEEQRG